MQKHQLATSVNNQKMRTLSCVLCAVTVIELIKLLSVNHFVSELFYNYILYKYKYFKVSTVQSIVDENSFHGLLAIDQGYLTIPLYVQSSRQTIVTVVRLTMRTPQETVIILRKCLVTL